MFLEVDIDPRTIDYTLLFKEAHRVGYLSIALDSILYAVTYSPKPSEAIAEVFSKFGYSNQPMVAETLKDRKEEALRALAELGWDEMIEVVSTALRDYVPSKGIEGAVGAQRPAF